MGKRTDLVFKALSASMQRVMKAIELHTHPDLAKANHKHDDLASRQIVDDRFNNLSRHYIPGSKRQCVRYATENSISFNPEKVRDLTFEPGLNTFTFNSIVHFNALNGRGAYSDEKYLNNSSADWHTNGSLTTGGVLTNVAGVGGVSTNRISLADSKKSIIRYITQLGKYSNYVHWSESFAWTPLSGKAVDTRYIFRTTCSTSLSSWSGNNSSGFFLYIQANSYKVALRLRLSDLSVVTLYIENFNHGSPSDANTGDLYTVSPATRYSIEVIYVNGAYKVYVNGIYKRLYDNTNRTAGDRVDAGDDLGYIVNKNVVIMGSSYTATPNKGFGGTTQGARGYIDEYCFKNIIDPDNYNPAIYTWNGTTGFITDSPVSAGIENDPNATPNAPFIGAEPKVVINESEISLALSGSNFLNEYTNVFDKSIELTGLPLNNRSYFYALYNKVEGAIIKSIEHTLVPFHYFDIYFKPRSWAGLWFSKVTPVDGDDFALPNDFYGIEWKATDFDVDVPGTGTQYQVGTTDIPGGEQASWAKLISTSDYMKSTVDKLGDRWSIRMYYQRMSNNNGILFQTTDSDVGPAKGIKVTYESDSIKVYISANGTQWVGAVDHLTIDASSANPAPGDYFPTALEFFDIIKNAGRNKSAVAIEIFYTGFKYGIRLGAADSSGGSLSNGEWYYWQWLDFDWADAFDGIVMPIQFEEGSSSIYDDAATLTIGDSAAGGIAGLRVHAFQVYPYVTFEHPLFGNRAFSFNINEGNFNDFIDKDIMWFDKDLMSTMLLVDGNTDFTTPNFINANQSVAMLGYADCDQGGVVNSLTYSNNARYESDWMQVNKNSYYTIKHRLGNKDIVPTVYLNKCPTLDKAFCSNNAGSDDAEGTWVSSITDTSLRVFTGTSHTYSGSAGGSLDKLYMKVVVERNW